MKKTVNFHDFCDAFATANRDNNFSYAGKQALFAYCEEYESISGREVELDVIALCCEYSEYESVQEVMDQHSIGLDDLGIDNPVDLAIEQIEEYVSDNEIELNLGDFAEVTVGHNVESVQEILKALGKTAEDLGIELDPDEDEVLGALEEYLRDRTQVVCCESDCILIADY